MRVKIKKNLNLEKNKEVASKLAKKKEGKRRNR